MIFVTNVASSLRFDVLAERYNAHVIRTPVGERLEEGIDNPILTLSRTALYTVK